MTTYPDAAPGETSGHAITALVFAVLGWLVLPVVGPIIGASCMPAAALRVRLIALARPFSLPSSSLASER